jgi:hypothetical protein
MYAPSVLSFSKASKAAGSPTLMTLPSMVPNVFTLARNPSSGSVRDENLLEACRRDLYWLHDLVRLTNLQVTSSDIVIN